MNRSLSAMLFASVLFVSGRTGAAAAQGPGVESMMGTYQCVTPGDGGRTTHFTSRNEPYGKWLRADFDFPAQNGQPADTAVTFLGFDSSKGRWNIVSMDVDGTYFTRYSMSRSLSGSHWTDAYPKDGNTAVLTIPDTRHWIFDLTSPAPGGRSQTSRVSCTRV